MPRRLFIAADLPDAVRRRLVRLIVDAPRGVRPVRPEHFHLTLHFVGAVDDDVMARLAAALTRIDLHAFTIDLVGIGVFPPRGRPTVLWAGVAPNTALLSLHASVAALLTACGLEPESRSWTPHVTLARLAPSVPRGWTADMLDRHRALAERGVPVTSVRLYESARTPDGPVHVPVATVTPGPGRSLP